MRVATTVFALVAGTSMVLEVSSAYYYYPVKSVNLDKAFDVAWYRGNLLDGVTGNVENCQGVHGVSVGPTSCPS